MHAMAGQEPLSLGYVRDARTRRSTGATQRALCHQSFAEREIASANWSPSLARSAAHDAKGVRPSAPPCVGLTLTPV